MALASSLVAILALALIGGLAALLVASARRATRLIDETWRAAAKELGATFQPSEPLVPRSIRLQDGDLHVRVETYVFHRGDSRSTGTRFLLHGPGVLPIDLSIRPRRTFTQDVGSIFRGFHGLDVKTGEESFDDRVAVQGGTKFVLAVLDRATRQELSKHVEDRMTVLDGSLVWETDRELDDPKEIVARVRTLRVLAARLRDPGPQTAARLAANAREDPIEGVRLANLLTLQAEFPGSTIAIDASRAALSDSAPAVQLAGAKVLKDDGFETLGRIATGSGVEQSLRIEALHRLIERAPRERVLPVLDRMLALPPWEVRREAVTACGRLRHAGAVAKLVAGLEPRDPPTATIVVEALGAIGDPSAEHALLDLLGADSEVATEAARALGKLGTVAAVEPLHRQAEEGVLPSTLKRVAREAIDAIQARLAGAERGQLALNDDSGAGGSLTVVEESRGGVSLPLPERTENGETC